jgi:pimeloyl-ACP methyl ester carboxylesterase
VKLEVVRIPGEGVSLAGLRYLPETPRPIALLYAHGFSSGKFGLDLLAGYLAGKGCEGLTFDFVGHKLGCTGGEMRTMEQAVENLRDALAWLRARTAAESVVLIGHSMGAAAALNLAARERERSISADMPKLAGLVCMCMGLEPTTEFDSPIGQTMLAQRQDYVAGAPALPLLTELNTLVLAAKGVADGLPALFIAAKQDVLVSVARVEALAALAGPDAAVTVIDSSHLDAPDRSRGVIAQWLDALPDALKDSGPTFLRRAAP